MTGKRRDRDAVVVTRRQPSRRRSHPAQREVDAPALCEQGRNAEAIDVYKKMLKLDPARPLSFNNLGWLYQEDGRPDLALAQFEQALSLQPGFVLAHISMGGLEEELGNMEKAEACFRKGLECDPGHTGVLARLATPRLHSLKASATSSAVTLPSSCPVSSTHGS